MSNKFWDQQDEGEFRDGMDETSNDYVPPQVAIPRPQRPAQQAAPAQQEEVMEDYLVPEIEEDEDDYSSVLSDARQRLESGRLYEMIMNHDLFEGLTVDAAAAKAVQRQIRKFAKEQMEIMLGMRRETAKVESLQIDFPFNQVEVEVLKMIAKTASKGKSEHSDNFVPKVTRTTEEIPAIPARKEGLNRLSGNTAPKAQPAKIAQKAAPAPVQQRQLPQKPAAPMQRKPLTSAEAQILKEEGVTREELDQVMDSGGLTKDPSQMTADELIAYNQKASQRRHRTVKNPGAMPMPSADQEAMLHQQRVIENSASPALNTIMSLINQQSKK